MNGIREVEMRKIRFGAGFTIFVLFFGIATIDAVQTGNWLRAAFWVAVGCAFMYLDDVYYSHHNS